MLLHESRRERARTPAGNLVLLDDQDRILWDRNSSRKAIDLVEESLRAHGGSVPTRSRPPSRPYTRRLHRQRQPTGSKSWRSTMPAGARLPVRSSSSIARWQSPCATAPNRDSTLIDGIFAGGELLDYPLAWSTHAELLRRCGEPSERSRPIARRSIFPNKNPPAGSSKRKSTICAKP